MRLAPNANFHVGKAFPGDGPETFPYERNNRTRRIVRTRPELRITDRRQEGQDIDPPMAPLRLKAPYRQSPDSVPAPSAGGATAGGLHATAGCPCGRH